MLSFPVQCAGEQSPPSKGISEETTLMQADCPRQGEGDKLSLALHDSKHILLETGQARQAPNYAEDDTLQEFNYASQRHMDELPNVTCHYETPLLNIECSQSLQGDDQYGKKHEQVDNFLETDSQMVVDCSISDGTLDAKASFPREKLCKEEAGLLRSVQIHSFPYLQCNGKRSCPEQKQVELIKTVDGSSGYRLPMVDMLPVVDCSSNVINEDQNERDAMNEATSISSETEESHGDDKKQLDILHEPMDFAFQTDFEPGNLSVLGQNIERFSTSVESIQPTDKIERQVLNHTEEGESDTLGADYLEDNTLALWVKWRGKWQTGFQCPRVDCPLQTLRAKPTHDRKKYIAIFFPRKRTYSWADLLLIRSINEFPEPLASGTHRKWRKMVKDLTIPRRYVMQKLAVAMLHISDQLHTEAVAENSRKASTWKEFAMEASSCKYYSDLGKMLLKLQTMILPTFVSNAWLENLFDSWKQRCQRAHSAESIEVLTKELMDSVQWSSVDDLWNAPVQPDLGPEWRTWKQEAMKLFSTSHPIANGGANVSWRHSVTYSSMEPQISRKLPKLEVRRAESCASLMNSGHSICQDIIGSTPIREPLNVQSPSEVDVPLDSETVDDRSDEFPNRDGSQKLIQSSEQLSAYGRSSNAPYQYRQCSAFIAAKGRQCGRWASDGDVYCCVHTSASSVGKSLQDLRPPPDAPMCGGVTTHGHKCKHRARLGSAFCKKHGLQKSHDSMEMYNLSVSSRGKLKRKLGKSNALEKFSSSNASNGEELGLITEYETSIQPNLVPIAVGATSDERNCLMKESELYNALLTPVVAKSADFPLCIGYYGQSNSEQCLEHAKRHSLYCDKHIPKFLKRARDGKSRLVSKDVFANLLKSCTSRKQKLHLHQACELLYGFMRESLSCHKPIVNGDIMDWTLSEASKDLNVGEYLLKLVSCEREKIMRLWGFGAEEGKEFISTGTNALSILEMPEKECDLEMIVQCKICAVEFSDDQTLGAHWTDIHKKEARWLFRGFACAVCMSSFTNRKVLKSHVKERHGIQFLGHSILFRCMSCNGHFLNPEQLWQHVFSSHLTELKMTDHRKEANHTMNQPYQNSGVSVNEGDPQRCICKFCGLKFDVLQDLRRHHQVAHMNPGSIDHFKGNHYIKHNKYFPPRFKKSFGAAFRFKKKTSFGMQKRFPLPNLGLTLKPKFKSHASETMALGRLLESHCSDVAEALFSEMLRTKPRPSNLEILSIARSACCRISLHAALEVKYGVLPENLYLKAAKLCNEQNIQIGWHLEGFICPRGCKPLMTCHSSTSMNAIPDGILVAQIPPGDYANDPEWEMEECHYILDPKHFNWKVTRKPIVLCEDISFGKEPVPMACVVDENYKDMLNIGFHQVSNCQDPPSLAPWQNFTYVTKCLIEPSLGLDVENTQLGCACSPSKCSPEKCDHVYLFDNDYENAMDIHGKPMRGRFPYDENGRIVLEQGNIVYECNSLCNCDATCHNRVLQKGIHVKLEIFKTEKKGWAVRAGQAIPRGTFVCEYIGEVMADVDGNKMGERYNNVACNYLYDINVHAGPRGLDEGTTPYVIDATKFGNVSRFINHSCSPNLVNYLVLVESMDYLLAHIGLYASQDIARGEELAYDYRNELLPGGGCPCYCGAPNCRVYTGKGTKGRKRCLVLFL